MKVTRPPGFIVSVGAVTGGVTAIGCAIVTVGAWPDESHGVVARVPAGVVLADRCRAAIAPTFQLPSWGRFTSCCQVVLTAPGLSGSIRKVV